MKLIQVQATPKASLRTKNRLNEHGAVYELHDLRRSVLFAPGPHIRVKSCTEDDGEQWHGWFPTNEVEYKEL